MSYYYYEDDGGSASEKGWTRPPSLLPPQLASKALSKSYAMMVVPGHVFFLRALFFIGAVPESVSFPSLAIALTHRYRLHRRSIGQSEAFSECKASHVKCEKGSSS